MITTGRMGWMILGLALGTITSVWAASAEGPKDADRPAGWDRPAMQERIEQLIDRRIDQRVRNLAQRLRPELQRRIGEFRDEILPRMIEDSRQRKGKGEGFARRGPMRGQGERRLERSGQRGRGLGPAWLRDGKAVRERSRLGPEGRAFGFRGPRMEAAFPGLHEPMRLRERIQQRMNKGLPWQRECPMMGRWGMDRETRGGAPWMGRRLGSDRPFGPKLGPGRRLGQGREFGLGRGLGMGRGPGLGRELGFGRGERFGRDGGFGPLANRLRDRQMARRGPEGADRPASRPKGEPKFERPVPPPAQKKGPRDAEGDRPAARQGPGIRGGGDGDRPVGPDQGRGRGQGFGRGPGFGQGMGPGQGMGFGQGRGRGQGPGRGGLESDKPQAGAAEKPVRPEPGAERRAGRGPGNPEGRPGTGAAPLRPNTNPLFDVFDANRDGEIQPRELKHFGELLKKALNENGDKPIKADEWGRILRQVARESRAEGGQERPEEPREK